MGKQRRVHSGSVQRGLSALRPCSGKKPLTFGDFVMENPPAVTRPFGDILVRLVLCSHPESGTSELDVAKKQIAGRGDVAARVRRQRLLRDLPLLEINDDARIVGRQLLASGPLPAQAEGDALHIGVAAVHGMEYLATWNCRHIANAWMRAQIEDVICELGYEPPVLCTPEELLEE